VPRVRHHTDDEGLEKIRKDMAIITSRGAMGFEAGVHVEMEPFGTARADIGGPKDQTGAHKEGAFVEFDAPPNLLRTDIGVRNTGIIPTGLTEPLSLVGLNPRFVKVRQRWWEFWRTKPE
jgi:hypothetical protein